MKLTSETSCYRPDGKPWLGEFANKNPMMAVIIELTLERFFDSDIAMARSRKGKHATFQAIAAHDQLAVGASGLWYCVSVHENFGLMAENVAEALSVGHHRLLAHIDDRAKRAALADAAVAQGLSDRGLKAVIASDKVPPDPGIARRGRPPLSPLTKGIRAAHAAVTTVTGMDVAARAELSPKVRVKASQDARDLADRLPAWAFAIAIAGEGGETESRGGGGGV